MEGLHHHQYHHRQHHQQQHQQPAMNVNVDVDRVPQWSIQETKEFLMIRAELDPSFMETKRNKQLWEFISTRLKEKGYNRSAEQCKCKWKNLVTRYKGCEMVEEEAKRQQQFPFYNDLQAIFSARKETTSKKLCSDEEEDKGRYRGKEKGKKVVSISGSTSESINDGNDIKEILKCFMRQQLEMEIQWREALEVRENERRLKEMEWRRTMEALENERVMMDIRWREKEEQRRIREEARSERIDALVTTLLNKLTRDDHMK
ncbi:hypothetical protein Gohar_018033 [Gossypium harknessii]|uniref:Myb-like domain-containing protein n=1 Tax=Gossypium harknessii TaxID=34285 RepID=A0A7J9G7W3_9ROSI|nr:hypothetical protein [Gossypium harknessii]